jgi:hypothetical protein
MRFIALACLGLAFALAGGTQLYAAQPETTAAQKATDYIRTLQNTDGGFPDFGATSSAGSTIDVAFAFAATGVNATTVTKGGKSPADFLAIQAVTYSATAGGAAKLVTGIATMKLDAHAFGTIDPLATMEAYYNSTTGKYGDDLFAQSLYMLAERSLGRPVPAAAVTYIESLQGSDGGWDPSSAFGEDTNATALVIRALIAAGVAPSDAHITNGLAYLKANQQADGGFTFVAPGDSDADSTAYGIQAILAAGQTVDAGGVWDKGSGKTPLAALKGFQNPTTGALIFFGTDNAFATYQGVPGLMLSAFPEQATFAEGAPSTNTPTSTFTNSPTITPTATPATFTPTATAHIKTATKTSVPSTATPAATSTSAAQKTVATGLVAGIDAAPTRIAVVAGDARLPSTGSGSDSASGAPISAIAMLLTGGGLLAAAGTMSVRKRRGPM